MTQIFGKRDIVEALHTRHGWPKSRCGELLDAFAALAAEALVDGDTVALPGLGRLSTSDTTARPGRNPRTGTPITIPAGRRVRFKPTKGLRAAVGKKAL